MSAELITALATLPLPIATIIIIGYLFGIKIPTICVIGLHSFKHTKDVKHIKEELVDSHSVCECGKERVRVFNMWGKIVREYYQHTDSKENKQ